MINFSSLLSAWNTPAFKSVLIAKLQQLEPSQLPLQQGLAVSSRVAGDCCADDPTPVCEQPEQCTMRLTVHKPNGEAEVALLAEDE